MCFLSFVADIIGTSNVTKAGQNVIQGLAVPSLESDNYDIFQEATTESYSGKRVFLKIWKEKVNY